jgi:hypothetical protein
MIGSLEGAMGQLRATVCARFVGVLFACALSACGSRGNNGFADDAGDDGSPFVGDEGGVLGDGGKLDGAPQGCSDAAKLIYLVTSQNDLYSFAPAQLAFKRIGALDCQTLASPNSMAVDRNAKAYVNMGDGSLFTVDTATAHCKPTSYQLGQQNRRIRGMGFSTDTSGGTADTLYTCTANDATLTGGGLAKISLPGFQLSLVGDYTNGLAQTECELAGTGDARLFGFYATLAPPKLAEIDKSSAATASPIPLGNVMTSSAYAFSFWGGDFWFYTSNGLGNSKVTRYKYATDKSFSVVVQDTGMTIVGAGVSTCAPVTPPN